MDRPHEGLKRADLTPIKVRAAEGETMPTLVGRYADPGEWTEIKSLVEGHFFERTSDTAFEKTNKEGLNSMRVLFHHGQDPRIGVQVMGKIARLDPDTAYEVPLYDTPEIRSLIPGLKDGQYGSSFSFDVVKEDVNVKPKRSDWNPEGIPEVTILEARVREFGPTPLPAYKGTSAGLRSVTDEFLLASYLGDQDRLRVLAESIRAAALSNLEPAPQADPAEDTTPREESRRTQREAESREEEKPSWLLE